MIVHSSTSSRSEYGALSAAGRAQCQACWDFLGDTSSENGKGMKMGRWRGRERRAGPSPASISS